MRVAGWILLLIGLATAGRGLALLGPPAEVRTLEARIDSLRAERETVRKLRAEVSIRRRGLQESLANLPDSLRMLQSGIVLDRMRELGKEEGTYRLREDSQTRAIRRFARRAQRLRNRTRRRARGPLGAGVAILVLGAAALSRARRGAA